MTCVIAQSALDIDKLPADPALRARAIMEYIDDLWRGESSRAEIRMQIQTAHWTRTLEMEAWSMGKDYSLVRINSPAKEAGTSTLKYQSDIYNYLPKTDRTIKITSGMMMSSWMGSHFTNDDLVKESRYAEDYVAQVVFEGERSGEKIWEIELDPKPDAPVVWGKIRFVVTQENQMPLSSDYYDEKGSLVRTIRFSNQKKFKGRTVPSLMQLIPAEKQNEFTQIEYLDLEYDLQLESGFFSLQNLKRH